MSKLEPGEKLCGNTRFGILYDEAELEAAKQGDSSLSCRLGNCTAKICFEVANLDDKDSEITTRDEGICANQNEPVSDNDIVFDPLAITSVFRNWPQFRLGQNAAKLD